MASATGSSADGARQRLAPEPRDDDGTDDAGGGADPGEHHGLGDAPGDGSATAWRRRRCGSRSRDRGDAPPRRARHRGRSPPAARAVTAKALDTVRVKARLRQGLGHDRVERRDSQHAHAGIDRLHVAADRRRHRRRRDRGADRQPLGGIEELRGRYVERRPRRGQLAVARRGGDADDRQPRFAGVGPTDLQAPPDRAAPRPRPGRDVRAHDGDGERRRCDRQR